MKGNPCRDATSGRFARQDLAARFWAYVIRTEYCWQWTGDVGYKGYGKFTYAKGVTKTSHHTAWFLEHGEWPTLMLRHTCDNPLCVRPNHLLQGTQKDNMADKVARGRQARGETHGSHVLTLDQVREIKQRHQKGEVQVRMAKEYGVSRATINSIASGRTWGWVQ